jgi:hypothetical protein
MNRQQAKNVKLNIMKELLLIALLFIGFLNVHSQVSINATNIAPDGSAMLDVGSSSKGLLIPRMTAAQRAAITSPANGLLVFDTDSSSFWYYNSADWHELLRGGGSANKVQVQADGSVVLLGNATVWNDLVVPPFSTYAGGDNPPVFGTFKTSVKTFIFENNSTGSEDQVFFSIQMPHNWKEGTTIYPHVHWSPQTFPGSGSIVWGFEYTWVNYNQVTPELFPNTTTLSATTAVISSSSDLDKHFLTSYPSISGSGMKISSILMCRFFRNSSNTADTFNGTAALLSFDIHYEIDAIGSRQEFIK